MDTTFVDKDKCFHLTFVPNNSQGLRFYGASLRIGRLVLYGEEMYNEPAQEIGVNFVDNMDIIQEFEQLPNGSGC